MDVARLRRLIAHPLHFAETTGSTQDDAKAAADAGAPAFSVFVAGEQTAGRGRQGRTWHATPGSSILCSVVLRPSVAPADLPRLALITGLAIAEALEDEVASVGIKWPNDVHVRGRKIAGVLVEGAFRGSALSSAVAGFGINLTREAVPPDLRLRATSLEHEGAPADAEGLLARVLERLHARVEGFERPGGWEDARERIRALDVLKGRRVHGNEVLGHAVGIADDGGLIVDAGPVAVTVQAGEVLVL